MRAGRIVVFFVLAGVAALLAATLTGSDDDGGLSLVVHAADTATEAKTARTLFTMTIDAPPEARTAGIESISFGGEGELDFVGNRAALDMEMSGADFGFELSIIQDGSRMYIRVPEEMAESAPTEWLLFDLAVIDPALAEQLGANLGGNNPAQTLDMLRGASDTVEEIGPEAVRGVETTHYQAQVDLRRALEEVSGEARELLAAGIEQLEEQVGSVVFPMDAWIDGDGLPRRVSYSFDLGAFGGGGGGEIPEGTSMTFTMEFFDYGADINIDLPPPDEVTDAGRLLAAVPS